MKTNIQFLCKEQTIQGKFYSAARSAKASPTLLLHGFPGNEDDVLGLGEALLTYGLNTLTFNYRGTYRSEGEFSLRNTLEDIQAAFDFLLDDVTRTTYQIDPVRLVLAGYSYGGGMGLIYAENHPEVRHVCSIAGIDHGEFAREYLRNETFSNMVDEMFEELMQPHGPVKFSGKLAIRNELIQNPDPFDLLSHTAQLTDRDVLLTGGWDDANNTVEHHILPCYRKLKELEADRVAVKAFQDDHSFEKSRSQIVEMLANWISSVFGEELPH